MSIISIVVNGLLKPDGTVQCDVPPQLPPGRVRITLQPLEEPVTVTERLPDPPCLDESIPAPFPLPRPDKVKRVYPRVATEHLPAPFEWVEEEGK